MLSRSCSRFGRPERSRAEAEFYSGGKRRSGILDIANSRFRQGSLRAVKQIPEPVADGAGNQQSGQRIVSGGAQYAVTGTTSVSEQRLSRLGGLIARRLADILRH